MLLQLPLELLELDGSTTIFVELREYKLALFFGDVLIEGSQESKELWLAQAGGLRVFELVEKLFEIDILGMNLHSQTINHVTCLFRKFFAFFREAIEEALEDRVLIQLLPVHPLLFAWLQASLQEIHGLFADRNSLGIGKRRLLNGHYQLEFGMSYPRKASEQHLDSLAKRTW